MISEIYRGIGQNFLSLGKTLVAELLLLARVTNCTLRLPTFGYETYPTTDHRSTPRQIGLFIAPYVSLIIEKENYFKQLLRGIGKCPNSSDMVDVLML